MADEELSLDQGIALLLSQVPRPVQDFVLNELSNTTRMLMERYRLHVDQGGVLERELLLMLLGQEEPADFITSLKEAGVDHETVSRIAADVNREVFIPLRKNEQTSTERGESLYAKPVQPAPAGERVWIQATPAREEAPKAAIPSYVPPAPNTPSVNAFNNPPAPARTAPPPAPPPPVPVIAESDLPPAPTLMHTMAKDMQMAQEAGKTPPPVPTPPIHVMPPPAPITPSPIRPIEPPQPKPPESYSVDPYRESFE